VTEKLIPVRHVSDRTFDVPMNRRMALKVLAVLTAASTLRVSAGDARHTSAPRNTPTDPDLVAPVVPWARTLSADQLATLAVLCDLILPADARSPAASALGAHDYIDEWVSAPYERQRQDATLVRDGLVWLDQESHRRFAARFRELGEASRRAIADDVCFLPRAAPEHRDAARFFALVRNLTADAVWTSTEGMADLGYVGNVPLPTWGPPPPDVLKKLGLLD